ncbi:DUF6894 family protein [Microvirga sp. 2TAF3]|uniref:DUF6894 family protein n=1 Tax=Microvirga sp. 2TAF3 TaxID=3233014 RepID=UPI003F94C948
MRCFFHLVNGHEAILDETGVEVPDLEAAWHEALSAIRELQEEQDGIAEEWSGWHLDVVCPAGNLLYSLDLNATLH